MKFLHGGSSPEAGKTQLPGSRIGLSQVYFQQLQQLKFQVTISFTKRNLNLPPSPPFFGTVVGDVTTQPPPRIRHPHMPPSPQHDPIITLVTHLIKSTTTTTYLPKARQINALILTSISIYSQTPFVYNHVISMYVRSGSLSDARKVFDKMPVRNVVSYNSMIVAYARENGCVGLGFEVVLGMCVHGMVVKFGLFCDAWVNTALLGLYSSVGDMESVEGLFSSLEFGDDVTWNYM